MEKGIFPFLSPAIQIANNSPHVSPTSVFTLRFPPSVHILLHWAIHKNNRLCLCTI